MKNLLLVAIAIFGFSAVSFGQNGQTATASTTATIITPIAITKSVDMNFGNVAVDAASGTVVLPTSGARTKSGGVALPVTSGTVSAAKFIVAGLGTSTYSISIPSSAITLTDGASHTMTVDNFVSFPSGTGVLSSGTQDLFVGATLNVGAAQPAGIYTNAVGLAVTVNYN